MPNRQLRIIGPNRSSADDDTSFSAKDTFSVHQFQDLPPGNCADGSPAIGPWSSTGRVRGTLACYTDETSGDALLYWSYDTESILVRARNLRGDAAALYDFFDRAARFIAP